MYRQKRALDNDRVKILRQTRIKLSFNFSTLSLSTTMSCCENDQQFAEINHFEKLYWIISERLTLFEKTKIKNYEKSLRTFCKVFNRDLGPFSSGVDMKEEGGEWGVADWRRLQRNVKFASKTMKRFQQFISPLSIRNNFLNYVKLVFVGSVVDIRRMVFQHFRLNQGRKQNGTHIFRTKTIILSLTVSSCEWPI